MGEKRTGWQISSIAAIGLALSGIAGCDQVGAKGNAGDSIGGDTRQGEGEACSPCEFFGNDAICLDRNLPPVVAALEDPLQGPALEQGASACGLPSEVCLPCVNPVTGQNTGACEIGPALCQGPGGESTCESPKAIIDPTVFEECEVGGRCVEKNIVESTSPGATDRLPACSQVADGVCVPEDALRYAGAYTPTSCSIGGPSGLEGRCLPSFVIPEESFDRIANLPKDPICGAEELCAPCFDPLTGEDTGACSVSKCDAPVDTTPGFDTCLEGRGQCVSPSIILAMNPEQSTDNLRQRDCDSEAVCVPNRLLAQPTVYQECTATFSGRGTCLDVDVLEVPLSGLFAQAECPMEEKCVPCQTLGQPTGAPGCE